MANVTNTNHVLWLLKLSEPKRDEKISGNKYIYESVLNFAKQFQKTIESQKDIEVVYIAQSGPAVMTSNKTVLPTTDWDITMVTKHDNGNDYKSFINSNQYKQILNKYPLSDTYHVSFNMKAWPIRGYSIFANISQFISNILGYFFQSIDPSFGYFPPYPFSDGSYEFISKQIESGTADKSMQTLKQLITIKDEEFLMLNLMQITDKKSDKEYASNVVGLMHGVGGRVKMMGETNDYWKQILFVYYPNTKRFWEMITSKNYLSMFQHKKKSLNDVLIMVTIPIYCHPQYTNTNIVSKL